MKKIGLMALSLCLVAVLAVGGTLAYLTDTDGAANVMTLGTVEIEQYEQQRVKAADGTYTDDLEAFEQYQNLMPAVIKEYSHKQTVTVDGYDVKIRDKVNNYMDKIINVKNTGKSDAYVRTIIAFPEAGEFDTTYNAADQWLHWNGVSDTDTTPGNGWMWGIKDTSGEYIEWPANTNNWDVVENVTIKGKVYDIYVATNKNVIKPGEYTAPALLGFFLDSAVNYNGEDYTFTDGNGRVWNLGDISQIEILAVSQAVQTDGFDNAWEALDAGFGKVNETNAVAWFGDLLPVDIIDNDADLKAAIEDPAVKNIYINGDLTYDWGGDSYANSKALLMKEKTFIGMGTDSSITFAGYGSANPIVDVTLKNLTVKDLTVGDNEGSWEHGYLEFEGLKAENVVFSDIMLDGNCVLNNCTFENNTSSWYAAWVEGGKAEFTNCVFKGTRGIKVHEEYSSDVKSVVVDGCEFTLSEKPGVVLGTLNAATEVVIKNGTFKTQAGDQSKYIYESDTDVTTIDFAESNNTVL